MFNKNIVLNLKRKRRVLMWTFHIEQNTKLSLMIFNSQDLEWNTSYAINHYLFNIKIWKNLSKQSQFIVCGSYTKALYHKKIFIGMKYNYSVVWIPNGTRCLPNGPKWFPNGPKSLPDGPKWLPKCPRWLNGPKWYQVGAVDLWSCLL